MSECTQFTLIKDRDWDMGFFQWIKYLKLRFQTRQWTSSLDFNSFKLHYSSKRTKNGITVEFPFSLSEETFARRMGFIAKSTIHIFWRKSPLFQNIQCPTSEDLPDETYWIFIMSKNFRNFACWVSLLERIFDSFNWKHNINGEFDDGHKVIRNFKGSPVGIYVTMPYAMTFNTFFKRMNNRLDLFRYVTKTSRVLNTDQLARCYEWGFFRRLDNGELYYPASFPICIPNMCRAYKLYWAVTNVEYIHKRTRKLMTKMILIIWLISFLVSIAPALGMKDDDWLDRVQVKKLCMVSQDLRYQIFATVMAFYGPLAIVLLLYWKIFQAAKSRIRKHVGIPCITAGSSGASGPRGGVIAGLVAGCPGKTGVIATAIVGAIGAPLPTITEGTTTNVTTVTTGTSGSSAGRPTRTNANDYETDIGTEVTSSTQVQTQLPKLKKKNKQKKGPLDSKRERKAAKTLAIITGVFVGCWMPFFVLALILPLCRRYQCVVPQYVLSFSLWLGYLNSTINPFIYTTFNPEFRNAFRRLFRGQRGHRRTGPPPRYV